MNHIYKKVGRNAYECQECHRKVHFDFTLAFPKVVDEPGDAFADHSSGNVTATVSELPEEFQDWADEHNSA